MSGLLGSITGTIGRYTGKKRIYPTHIGYISGIYRVPDVCRIDPFFTSGLFGNLLPSWGDPSPVPPETAEPPEPEEEPEVESDGESEYETASESPEELETESDGESEYETASAYQNAETRWYSATRRFLFWKK